MKFALFYLVEYAEALVLSTLISVISWLMERAGTDTLDMVVD
jgi:hypothetical protein